MDLSPNDIRNFDFSTQIRGYSKDEVDDFREQVAAALEVLKQDNLKLSTEAESLRIQLAGLRQFEDTIKSAAIDARRNADLTIANAKKEAELTLSRAKTEAMEIIGSRAQKASEIEAQITKLQFAKKSYLSKLRNLMKSHLEVLEEVADGELAGEPKAILEVTESTEVSRKKLETIATKPDRAEPIKTEEANAAEQILPASVTPEAEPSPTAVEDVSSDQTQHPDQSVDPELVAALEKYRHKDEPSYDQQPTPVSAADRPPAPGEMVETSARAEDIPEGFITSEADASTRDTTDKVAVGDDVQPDATEHNAIDMDTPQDLTKETPKVAPENLARELDRVVAKFEEEMDRAEKS